MLGRSETRTRDLGGEATAEQYVAALCGEIRFVKARHRVTLVVGDGVGPEVADATVHVLEAAGAPIEWEEVVAGERALVNYGTALPSAALDSIRRNGIALKARLRGAPGSANPNVTLRRELGLGTQLRPVKSLPGSRYPGLDLVVIRETTEGEYAGLEHRVVPGVVESIKVMTEKACLRIGEFAFAFAHRAGRKKVTAVHKANILKISDGLFLDCSAGSPRSPLHRVQRILVRRVCNSCWILPLRRAGDGELLRRLAFRPVCGSGGRVCAARAGNIGEASRSSKRCTARGPNGRQGWRIRCCCSARVLMLDHIGEGEAAERIEKAMAHVLQAEGADPRSRTSGSHNRDGAGDRRGAALSRRPRAYTGGDAATIACAISIVRADPPRSRVSALRARWPQSSSSRRLDLAEVFERHRAEPSSSNGFARFLPTHSGGASCTASKTAMPSPMLPQAADTPPARPAHRCGNQDHRDA